MDEKREKTRKVISYIVSLISALLIFALIICCVATFGVSKRYIRITSDSSDYISKSADLTKENLSYITTPSGLPDNFFNDKVTESQIENIFLQELENNYNSNGNAADMTQLKQELKQMFIDYVNSGESSYTNANEENLNYLADTCTTYYSNAVAPRLIKYFIRYCGKIFKVMPIADIGLSVLSGLAILLLYKINTKWFTLFLYYSVAGAGLMAIIMPFILLVSKSVNRINISTISTHDFISAYFNNLLLITVIIGVILVLIGIFIVRRMIKNDDETSVK